MLTEQEKGCFKPRKEKVQLCFLACFTMFSEKQLNIQG